MISFDQKKICLRAIDHYGAEHQKRKALEELGELIAALAREQDNPLAKDMVREELADVMIMCEQLRILYGTQEVDSWIDQKLERLWKDYMRLPERSR